MKGMTRLLQDESITEMLVVAMVINTVDNHKVHAARSFGKRRRKLTVELGDVGEMDRVSGKRPKLSPVPFDNKLFSPWLWLLWLNDYSGCALSNF